jgi:hypothetical protein
MALLLFLFKIAVPPVLVAAMSLAARRWGPTFGGLIMGLPWMTGPVLFFLALDKGDAFAVAATTGIELGVVSITAYMLAYALVSSFAPWPFALAAAVLSFAAATSLLQFLDIGLPMATIAALASLAFAALVLPRPRGPVVPVRLPAWDIPARMAVTFALVAIIMTGADALGSRLSGIVATFPVILTVIGTFTHHQSGVDAVRRVLRGLTLSLNSFVAFFVVVGFALPRIGLLGSYLAAMATAIAISAALVVRARR